MFNSKKIKELERRLKQAESIVKQLEINKYKKEFENLIGKEVSYFTKYTYDDAAFNGCDYWGTRNYELGILLDIVVMGDKIMYHIKGYGCTSEIIALIEKTKK